MTPEAKLTLEAIAARAKRGPGQCADVVCGWKIILEQDMNGLPGFHLSASLAPAGRSSTEVDWQFLGEALAVLGAPTGSLLTPLETAPPNDVHHWHWGASPQAIETMRQFLTSPAYKQAVAQIRGKKRG